MNKESKEKRIKFLEEELQRMSAPSYYGSWCSGYLKKAYEKELNSLKKN